MLAPHCEFDEPDPYFDLCRAGLKCYAGFIEALREETGCTIAFNTTGMIYPALSNGEQARLEDRYDRHLRSGIPVERLTAREASAPGTGSYEQSSHGIALPGRSPGGKPGCRFGAGEVGAAYTVA